MGTDLTGRGSAAPEIGAEKAKRKKRRPGRAPLPAGGLRSAIGVARFEADRSLSESTISLERRLASGEKVIIDGRIEWFAWPAIIGVFGSEYSEESDHLQDWSHHYSDVNGRGHPRFQPPSITRRAPPPAYARHLGALSFRDNTARCPFVRGSSQSSALVNTAARPLCRRAARCACGLRFPDRRGLSGALRGVRREALCAAVARQPRWLPCARLSRPLRRPRADSDTDPGHGGEHFRGLHAGEVGVAEAGDTHELEAIVLHGRSESKEFYFYAEESAQLLGEDICAEDRKQGNRL
jgi:hypothetical protein